MPARPLRVDATDSNNEADVPDTNLEPRKIPQQRRSHEQVEKILAATRAILRERGAGAVTAVTIARDAGVSVGSFYQYFPNKKAVLIALYHAYLDGLHGGVEQFESAEYQALGWREFFSEVIGFVKRQEMRGAEDPGACECDPHVPRDADDRSGARPGRCRLHGAAHDAIGRARHSTAPGAALLVPAGTQQRHLGLPDA